MNMIIKVEDEIWFPFIGYGWKPFEWMVFKRCKDVIRKYNAWIKDLCEEHNHNPIHENVFDFHVDIKFSMANLILNTLYGKRFSLLKDLYQIKYFSEFDKNSLHFYTFDWHFCKIVLCSSRDCSYKNNSQCCINYLFGKFNEF